MAWVAHATCVELELLCMAAVPKVCLWRIYDAVPTRLSQHEIPLLAKRWPELVQWLNDARETVRLRGDSQVSVLMRKMLVPPGSTRARLPMCLSRNHLGEHRAASLDLPSQN